MPSVLQQSFVSLGNLFIQGVVNSFGSSIMAGYTAAVKLNLFTTTCLTTLATGISSYCAQNIGAGNPERARNVLKVGAAMMAVVSVFLTLVVLIFGSSLIALFGLTLDTVEIGRAFFYGIAPFYIVFGLSMAIRGYLEGCGDMLFSGLAGVSFLVVRIICSYALDDMLGNMVIAYAEAIAWIFLLALVSLRYLQKRKKSFVK